jgi:hypothetical protein
MESKDTSITRLKEELKKSNKIILDLLRERETMKKAYDMQIDLREALEKKVKNLEINV